MRTFVYAREPSRSAENCQPSGNAEVVDAGASHEAGTIASCVPSFSQSWRTPLPVVL